MAVMNNNSRAVVQVQHEDRIVRMMSVTESEWREATRLGRQFTVGLALCTSSATASITLYVAGMASGATVAGVAAVIFGLVAFLAVPEMKTVTKQVASAQRELT